jgi:hypothetical protein
MSVAEALLSQYAFIAWRGKLTFYFQAHLLCFFLISLCLKGWHVYVRWINSESWHKEINCSKYSSFNRPRLAEWFMQQSNKCSSSQRQIYVTCRLPFRTVIRKLPLGNFISQVYYYFIWSIHTHMLVSLPKWRTKLYLKRRRDLVEMNNMHRFAPLLFLYAASLRVI